MSAPDQPQRPLGRMSRRTVLRSLAASSVPVVAGLLLQAPRVWAAGRSLASPIVLEFAPWGQWPGIGPDWQKFVRPPIDAFEEQNKGIVVNVVPPVSGGAALPQLLAGTAPDIFSEYDIVPYMEQHSLLVNLQPILQQDNISPSIWSAGQMTQYYTEAGLWFLPNYLNVAVIAINLGNLDDLGLAYPSPDWTYEEAERLFRATTRTVNGVHQYGFAPVFRGIPYDSAGPLPNAQFALEIFGGTVLDATRTKSLLDDPKVVSAAEWWMQLYQSGVATSATSQLASPWRATFVENRNNYLLFDARNWTHNYKWTFAPIPHYPAGQISWVGSEGYGINAATKNVEAAATFMRFLVVETAWQRYGMKTILKPPSILSLWPEMTAIMEQTVPGFRGKGLHWYQTSASSWGHAVPAFKYNPVAAMNLTNTAFSRILSRSEGVAGGLLSLSKQINALQAANRAVAAAPQMSAAAIRAVPVSPTSTYAGPPVEGVGLAPQPTPYILERSGSYKLLGDGTDCYNASDNTTFACISATETEGDWICRIVSIANLSCPHLSQWAKVGLMARADLTDDAPAVFLHLTGAHEVEWMSRVEAELTPSGSSGLSTAAFGSRPLVLPNTKPAANYMVRPLWLRLSRKGMVWTAWGSADGAKWSQVGAPLGCVMGACWVGIQACSHNSSFGNKGYIRATFDQLNFRPTKFEQVGRLGVPPQAGNVPANWAVSGATANG